MREEIYRKRRERLVGMMPLGVAVITASELKVRSNDTEYPYRQDSDFYYLTGFEEDSAALVLSKSRSGIKTVLFLQDKDDEMELWTGKRLGVEAAGKRFAVDKVYSIGVYEKEMEIFLKGCSTLLYEMFSEKALCRKVETVSKRLVQDRSVKISPRVHMDITALTQKMRLVKSSDETDLIKKALSVTKEAHHHAMRLCRPGMMEYELQAEYEYLFKKWGAGSDAYTTIIAGGNSANTLHYISNNQMLKDGDLVLIDAGCEFGMYASDITRTFPVNGRFTKPQRELYEMVLDVQHSVMEAIRPGITKEVIQKLSERLLCEGMARFGILKGDVPTLLEKKAHRKYFPHGIGHWMGLDVHDPCPYVDENGDDTVFEAGMVLTVEPGIYIREDDDTVPLKYRGIGIRIEDNILVTVDGCENLSEEIAKTVDEIEAMCLAGNTG